MNPKAIYVILIVLLLVSVWQWRGAEKQLDDTRSQLARMETHAQVMEKKVFALEKLLAEKEKQTVGGIAEEANSLLLEGWDAVLEEFEKKLEETKERMNERFKERDDSPRRDKGASEKTPDTDSDEQT